MPTKYSFSDRIITLRLSGSYSTDDLKEAVSQSLVDPSCPHDPRILFDQRETTSLRERSVQDVRDMADFLAGKGGAFGSRLAMVTSDALGFGMMRMGSVFAESGGLEARVFTDVAEAKSWLLR